MVTITDEKLISALELAVGKKPKQIKVSCRLYHFYFDNTSFSYDKADVIKLLGA